MLLVRVHLDRHRAAVGMAQRGLERFGQALLGFRADLQPVDDDLDGMLAGLLQGRQCVDFIHLAVDAQPRESLRAQFVEQIQLLALALHHQRRQDHYARVLRQLQHMVHHLAHALRLQHQIVLRAIRVAGAREQAGAGNRESR